MLNWLTPQIQAIPARERAISSMKIDWIVQLPPWPPSSSSMPIPKKPASAMFCHSCSGKFEPSWSSWRSISSAYSLGHFASTQSLTVLRNASSSSLN